MPERNREELVKNMLSFSYQKARVLGLFSKIEELVDSIIQKINNEKERFSTLEKEHITTVLFEAIASDDA